MITQEPSFLPGDIIFYHNDDWFGKLFQFAMKGKDEPSTFCNHISGFINYELNVEALWKVEVTEFELHPKNKRLKVYRKKNLSDKERDLLALKAVSYVGREYGFAKLITHLGDALLEKMFDGQIFFFRRLNHSQRYPICSWVWAYSYYRVLGYKFGIDPEGADPDTMYDFVVNNSDWELIYSSEE